LDRQLVCAFAVTKSGHPTRFLRCYGSIAKQRKGDPAKCKDGKGDRRDGRQGCKRFGRSHDENPFWATTKILFDDLCPIKAEINVDL
jgi:hypothetical protein